MKAKHRLLLIASAVALVLLGLVVLISRRHEQLYKVTVLPSLGLQWTLPKAINDRGQIAGFADVAIVGRLHMFIWDSENGMKDLGPLVTDDLDINNAGQITGTMTDPNGNSQAFFWDPKDGKQLLGTLGGTESYAKALNNRGQVVGFSHRDKNRPEAFIWDKTNGMRSLTPDERQYGKAWAINDAGHMLGEIGIDTGDFSPFPNWMLCCWDSTDPGATPELSPDGYLGGRGINNNGYVLNPIYPRPKRGYWVCLWHKDAEIKWLFPRKGSISSIAFNDSNQVLYSEYHSSSFARLIRKFFPSRSERCLWDPKRGKVALNNQVPRKLGKLVHVADINNQGCIVGYILLKESGQVAGVLLEPIPERWGR
ncbi:MAG: hypothetical protein ACYSUD_17055 [Planctomycetota bacterium]|jgi:probable HAF family extracellular repeat protein